MSQSFRLVPTAETDMMYRLLVQGVTDYAIYMLSPDGMVSNWNAGAQRAKGYEAAEIVGQNFSRFYPPDDRARGMPQRALSIALAEGRFEGEGWRLRRDGSRFWAHVVIHPIRDEKGCHIGFAKITRDLTEKRRQSEQLRRVKDNLDLALDNMSQGLALFDRDERLILANGRLREMLDLGEPEDSSLTLSDILRQLHGGARDGAEVTAARLRRPPAAGSTALPEEISADGRVIAVSHRVVQAGGWVTTFDDITNRRVIEDRIIHLAHHDTLTALPNRATFRARLEELLAHPGRKGSGALLYLDLDRFKPVNDTLGHAVGDLVLQTVAQRIQLQIRKRDTVARLGGDEFALLLRDSGAARDAVSLAGRLIREICRPIPVQGGQVTVGASIGIALIPGHGEDAETLLRNADLALYRAKEGGRNCHRLYEPGMEQVMRQRQELERDLRLALRHGEFRLHYQPVVDIDRSVVTSFEALLRWSSPTRGLVPPGSFIPFAEEVGLMTEIGDWVIRTACRDAATWPGERKVSVNLSPTQLRTPDLVIRIAEALRESGLPAARLELEVTETAMIDDLRGAASILAELRALGIHIALDDFGTGYSSLSFLRSLPFNRIKIDRSFVQDLGNKPEAAAIVRVVAGFCESLGLCATAEGVETAQQMALLREQGCPEVQGYFVSHPCPADTVADWIAAFEARAASGDAVIRAA